MKILLVEDDKLLNHHLSSLLTEADNQVYSTDKAEIALHYAVDYPIDVAIIDLGLPDMDGLQLIRRLRERQIPFPIIVLTARGNWQDKVEGLEAGADDYLVKPFQKDELLARLNALVRRSAGFISPKVKAGDYELDLSRKELTIAGEVAVLTSFEYLILEYLMRNARQVVSKQQLLDQLYGALLLKSGNYPAVWRSDLLGSPPGVPDGQVQAQDQQLETVQPSLGATWFVDRMDG
ncbi:response regulator transcription factor [Aeromonas allosaccharophila]|uniref:response regulator transcription factor n=1 Tax=Aeromonas allosaccharophila TaxID=656 RepID=UPI0030B92821